MNFASTIREIDILVAALTQARQLMADFSAQHNGPQIVRRKHTPTGNPTGTPTRRHLSPAAIKRIQEAQRKRWAKYHREKAKARSKGKKSHRAAK